MSIWNLEYQEVQSFFEKTTLDGYEVLRGRKDMMATQLDDEPTYAKLADVDFHNGILEVTVLSRLLPDAPEHARGFIGLAYRINADDTAFESLYIRPTNGRAPVQLRRNRATQYFSYPDFKFFHSRETNPGEYESYADMGLDEWITLKMEIVDSTAKLYLNDGKEPVLIVNDMKMGPDARGSVGLWVEIGTDGYFRDLKITKFD